MFKHWVQSALEFRKEIGDTEGSVHDLRLLAKIASNEDDDKTAREHLCKCLRMLSILQQFDPRSWEGTRGTVMEAIRKIDGNGNENPFCGDPSQN